MVGGGGYKDSLANLTAKARSEWRYPLLIQSNFLQSMWQANESIPRTRRQVRKAASKSTTLLAIGLWAGVYTLHENAWIANIVRAVSKG